MSDDREIVDSMENPDESVFEVVNGKLVRRDREDAPDYEQELTFDD